MYAVHVENLVKYYSGKPVLNGVNLDVEEGQFYALMGPNGSGKTTLASIIAAVRPWESGTVEIYGKKPAQAKTYIGYVPQENFSSPKLSGKENLTYFARLLGYTGQHADTLVMELLSRVGLVADANKRVGKYSGGMRKRLEVATALFPQTNILILDEPTTGLDPTARRAFFAMIREIMQGKNSILLITHIGTDAELASKVGLIDNGKIIAEGTPEELKNTYTAEDTIVVETSTRSSQVTDHLAKYSMEHRVTELPNGYKIYVKNGDRVLADVVRTLDEIGNKVQRIEMTRPTLEDVFFKLTEKTISEVSRI